MSKNEKILFGVRPTIELVKSDLQIKKIWIEQGKSLSKFEELIAICDQKQIEYGEKSFRYLAKLAGTDKHQGIIAIYTPLERAICFESNHPPRNKSFLCIYLDRIQDPQNFGAIIRSSEFFEVDQIFYPEHHGAPFNETAIKASSGAGIHNPPYKIGSITTLFEKFQDYDFNIIGTSVNSGKEIKDINLKKNTLLIIGNEHEGISEKIKKYCTAFVNIPVKGRIDSLNASVSAGIFLYQIQKGK